MNTILPEELAANINDCIENAKNYEYKIFFDQKSLK